MAKRRPWSLRRLASDARGSSAVEFALVAPILVSMLFGVFEFGRVLWTQSVLDFAVQQASRCATVDTATCTSAAAIESYAAQETGPLSLPSNVFTASSASCGNEVTASYAFSFIAPNLFPYSLTLTSQSCFPT